MYTEYPDSFPNHHFVDLNFFVCPRNCGRRYKHKSHLNVHLKYECGVPKRFKCDLCDKAFARKENFKTHMIMKHKRILPKIQIDKADLKLNPALSHKYNSCSNQSFNSHLERKYDPHSRRDHSSHSKQQYDSHSKHQNDFHSKQKYNSNSKQQFDSRSKQPYGSHSKQQFDSHSKQQFDSHSKQPYDSHSKQQFDSHFKQPYDSYSKQQYDTQSNHSDTNSNGDGYRCPKECGRKYKHKRNLNYHLKYECGPKNFKCEVCGDQFTLKETLQKHLRSNHQLWW
ncbi:hypothetical protein V9T40_010897 [Parthenolecanium corni]|uniref:C2H2-type domain-containing protein n=1 Tax=Parthenolecanium corni TaxID=536013 RepID=A0AAN9TIY8_9HEMI